MEMTGKEAEAEAEGLPHEEEKHTSPLGKWSLRDERYGSLSEPSPKMDGPCIPLLPTVLLSPQNKVPE